MTDQLITSETAKLAKEKGYPQGNNSGIYHTELRDYNTGDRGQYINHERFLIITQSLLQRWLREVHKLFIEIADSNGVLNQEHFRYAISELHGRKHLKISQTAFNFENKLEGNYKTYEEALEQGLTEALKLI